MRKLLILLLVLLILYILFKPKITEQFEVAVMPNEFIQKNDNPVGGNNLDNCLSAQFQPDNLDLKQFFKFTTKTARYYPKSNRIINDYYIVPRVI